MSDDLPALLRRGAGNIRRGSRGVRASLLEEAADEITLLRAALHDVLCAWDENDLGDEAHLDYSDEMIQAIEANLASAMEAARAASTPNYLPAVSPLTDTPEEQQT